MTSKDVPEDVVFDILLKLPVKSLLTFRCVCKEWHRLLDSPYFISKHLEYSRTNKTTCVLVLEDKTDINAFSLVSEETLDIVSPKINFSLSNGIDFYGPVNGIVAVFRYDKLLYCNPSTREVKTLPPCNIPPDSDNRVAACGFGFDEKSNDYKFVRIILCGARKGRQNMKFQIYSLVRDCWRNLDHLAVPNASFTESLNGYLNGGCHFFVHYRHIETEYAQAILSFRMDTEVFEEVPISHGVRLASYEMRPTICVTGKEPNNLSVIFHSPVKRIFEVWVMREYGVKESWSKQYTVGPLSISELFSPYPCNAMGFIQERSLYPMSIGNDNELLLCGWYGEFVLYNIDTQKFRVLKAYEEDEAFITSAYYMETLVSIKRASGVA